MCDGAERRLIVIQSNAKDYFTCQFTYSVNDPQTGHEHCGEPQDWDMGPSEWTFIFNVLSVSVYGMVSEAMCCCMSFMHLGTRSFADPFRGFRHRLQL
jgi:hypothetical protein